MRSSDHNPTIVLANLSYDDLKHVVEIIYKGSITVSENFLDGLMNAANFLEISGVKPGTPGQEFPAEKMNEETDQNDDLSTPPLDIANLCQIDIVKKLSRVDMMHMLMHERSKQSTELIESHAPALHESKDKPSKQKKSQKVSSKSNVCTFCSTQLKNMKVAIEHKRSCPKNPFKEDHVCEKCKKHFTRKTGLRLHMKNIHFIDI